MFERTSRAYVLTQDTYVVLILSKCDKMCGHNVDTETERIKNDFLSTFIIMSHAI